MPIKRCFVIFRKNTKFNSKKKDSSITTLITDIEVPLLVYIPLTLNTLVCSTYLCFCTKSLVYSVSGPILCTEVSILVNKSMCSFVALVVKLWNSSRKSLLKI